VDRLQMSCEHRLCFEPRSKTSETVGSAYTDVENFSKRWERSMRTDEQQRLSMKTVLTVGLTYDLRTRDCL